eukprot:377859_1
MTIITHIDKEKEYRDLQETTKIIKDNLKHLDYKSTKPLWLEIQTDAYKIDEIVEIIVTQYNDTSFTHIYDQTILELIQNGNENTYELCNKLAELLPQPLQDTSYIVEYKEYLQQWLLHDFYNFLCSRCGTINSSIMVNRTFQYSSKVWHCRTCGIFVPKQYINKEMSMNIVCKPIEWFCMINERRLTNKNIDQKVMQITLTNGRIDENLCDHVKSEFELLNWLHSLLSNQEPYELFDSLINFLIRYLDYIDEWKALRVAIVTNYYFHEFKDSFVPVDTLMQDTAIKLSDSEVFKKCWNKALFPSAQVHKQLNQLLNNNAESKYDNDVLCCDPERLIIFKKLTPSISKFIASILQHIPNDIKLVPLVKRLLDYKIDENVFSIINEIEFLSIISNKWDYLRDPIPKYQSPKLVTYWKSDIQPLHQSLKDEVLNQVTGLNESRYQSLVLEAKNILENRKNMRAKPSVWNSITGIPEGKRISENHIISVLLFVNFDELRNKIIMSLMTFQTKEEENKLHAQFYHLLKLMKETVVLYGEVLESNEKMIYCTINSKVLFKEFFTIELNVPIIAYIKTESAQPQTMGKLGNKIVLELEKSNRSQPIPYFDVSTIIQGYDQKLYLFANGIYDIKNIQFIDDDTNKSMNSSMFIGAILLFEKIMKQMSADKSEFQHKKQVEEILEKYLKERMSDQPTKGVVIPSNYYHHLFEHCFDHFTKFENIELSEKQLSNYVNRTFLKDTFLNIAKIARKHSRKINNLKLNAGSKCKVYVKQEWFLGDVVDKKGKLYVKYAEDTLSMDQIGSELHPVIIDKWCIRIWKRLNNDLITDNTLNSESEDVFTNSLIGSFGNMGTLSKFQIKLNPKLILRVKTVLAHYKTSRNTIPSCDVFLEETNINFSESSIKNGFEQEYNENQIYYKNQEILKLKESKRTKIHHKLHDTALTVNFTINYETFHPKFACLFQELLFNDVIHISKVKLPKYLAKAKKFYQHNYLLKRYRSDNPIFGIRKCSPMNINHIISIIVYVEDQYSEEFTKSYLSLTSAFSKTAIQTHLDNFYWFSRYIFECIQFYGETFDDDCRNKHFYPSKVTLRFSSFSSLINLPQFVTPSIEKALYRAGDEGCVLELIPKYRLQLDTTKFISLSATDTDTQDDIRLTVGDIQIKNIILSSGQSLSEFVVALSYLEKILTQTIVQHQFYNSEHLYQESLKTQSILYNLILAAIDFNEHIWPKFIQHQIINKYFPERCNQHREILYVISLLNSWSKAVEYVSFEAFSLELPFMIPQLKDFFLKNSESMAVNIENLQLLLPNLNYFKLSETENRYMDKHTTTQSSIIDIINNNLKYYYQKIHNKPYQDTFKLWCESNGLDALEIAQELEELPVDCSLVDFDNLFPLNINKQNMTTEERSRYVYKILQECTKQHVTFRPLVNEEIDIIDIVNNNISIYYSYVGTKQYANEFKLWCEENKYDEEAVENELDKDLYRECKLIAFDKEFPINRQMNSTDRAEYIYIVLQNCRTQKDIQNFLIVDKYKRKSPASHTNDDQQLKQYITIKLNALDLNIGSTSYLSTFTKQLQDAGVEDNVANEVFFEASKLDKKDKFNDSHAKKDKLCSLIIDELKTTNFEDQLINTLYSDSKEFKVEDIFHDKNITFKSLSSCQRHEVPIAVCCILQKLGHKVDNDGTMTRFMEKNRDKLLKFYEPISKGNKATKEHFLKIIEETHLFEIDNKTIAEKLCNNLMYTLFTDIENTKTWQCNQCAFMNRKMMVNGLWRLYNQSNICGLCGFPRYIDNKDVLSQNSNQIKVTQSPNDTIDESTQKNLKLPQKLITNWKLLKTHTCSIEESKNDNQDYVETWNQQQVISFVTKYIDKSDSTLKIHKKAIKQYLQREKIDGRKFLSLKKKEFVDKMSSELSTKYGKVLRLYSALLKMKINCHAMKRLGLLLDHFHNLTEKVIQQKTDVQYPYLVGELLSTLNELNGFNVTQLLDDFDHISKHGKDIRVKQPYVKCKNGDKCIHLHRTEIHSKKSLSLQQKQKLFHCNDWKDFVFISYLDKIHCSMLHSAVMFSGIKKDEHIIHRYSKFEVFSSGVFFQYDALAPLHANLRQELTNNVVYPISEENFKEAIFASKNILNTQKMKEKQWRAIETNDVYGIQIGDQIHIEHIICIYLYCSNSELCTKFRESYRPSQFDDNNIQIRSYHINNFYWMGRFIYTAIQFFGQKPTKDDTFYHGQNKQFLFTEFSTILEAPTSTTSDWKIAKQKFSGENGIVLKLTAKFKYELNNNKYLNVSSISEYNDEKEKLFAGMTVLAIIDIGYAYANRWYWLGHHTKVLLYFERLITQTIHQRNNYNYGFVSKSVQKKYLIPLIEHQINRNREHKIQHIAPERHYLYALFEHFCDMRTNYIDLTCIHKEIETMHRSLINILFEHNTGNHKHKINNESIKLIFPKLKGYKNHLGYWINFS